MNKLNNITSTSKYIEYKKPKHLKGEDKVLFKYLKPLYLNDGAFDMIKVIVSFLDCSEIFRTIALLRSEFHENVNKPSYIKHLLNKHFGYIPPENCNMKNEYIYQHNFNTFQFRLHYVNNSQTGLYKNYDYLIQRNELFYCFDDNIYVPPANTDTYENLNIWNLNTYTYEEEHDGVFNLCGDTVLDMSKNYMTTLCTDIDELRRQINEGDSAILNELDDDLNLDGVSGILSTYKIESEALVSRFRIKENMQYVVRKMHLCILTIQKIPVLNIYDLENGKEIAKFTIKISGPVKSIHISDNLGILGIKMFDSSSITINGHSVLLDHYKITLLSKSNTIPIFQDWKADYFCFGKKNVIVNIWNNSTKQFQLLSIDGISKPFLLANNSGYDTFQSLILSGNYFLRQFNNEVLIFDLIKKTWRTKSEMSDIIKSFYADNRTIVLGDKDGVLYFSNTLKRNNPFSEFSTKLDEDNNDDETPFSISKIIKVGYKIICCNSKRLMVLDFTEGKNVLKKSREVILMKIEALKNLLFENSCKPIFEDSGNPNKKRKLE